MSQESLIAEEVVWFHHDSGTWFPLKEEIKDSVPIQAIDCRGKQIGSEDMPCVRNLILPDLKLTSLDFSKPQLLAKQKDSFSVVTLRIKMI